MLNFDYHNPVRVVFGRNTIGELPKLLPPDVKIMLTYGGGSIFKNGVYDQVKKALQDYTVVEFGGIEANPHYETCMKAVELGRAEQVGFLLAVGGGSVVDATKFIAAAIPWTQGDPWEFLLSHDPRVAEAIPLGCVITLPATGSEMNCAAVITRAATQEKYHFYESKAFPRFSIIDPQVTFSLPQRQVINGIVDTFVHVMEQYMTYDVQSPLQDRQAESVIKTLIEEAPKVLAHPDDYDVRANLFWASTVALNGLLAVGVVQDWATHMIGHELTALYGLDHAVTLAIVLPELWRFKLIDKKDKLTHFGKEVFGVSTAEAAIAKVEEFFHSIDMKTKLAEHGVSSEEAAEKVRDRFSERGTKLGERGDIDGNAAYAILSKC
ncbi:MAG: iron-containing alcohol dehydrogenase [Candidatus Hydrogenedentales bacterium]|jgi:NADP-dependent alcohol dehydrogenase